MTNISQRFTVSRVDWKVFITVFFTVLLAELGDKSQFVTALFATHKDVSKLSLFLAASVALVFASAVSVLAGILLSDYINEKYLHYLAGMGFIGIGIWTLYNA